MKTKQGANSPEWSPALFRCAGNTTLEASPDPASGPKDSPKKVLRATRQSSQPALSGIRLKLSPSVNTLAATELAVCPQSLRIPRGGSPETKPARSSQKRGETQDSSPTSAELDRK